MRINPNSGSADVAKVKSHPQAEEAVRKSRLGADKAALNASEAVDQAFQNVPAVRPEKVARAKALLSDDSFPSEAQLGDVAGLLAKHLSK